MRNVLTQSFFSIAMLSIGFPLTSYGNEIPLCTTDGQVGCVTTKEFRAVDMAKVRPVNIRAGISIAGVSGGFPSTTYPLWGSSATTDLNASHFEEPPTESISYEFWTSSGKKQTVRFQPY
ncbi:MAG: hypothetical protein AB7T49_14515 [Oligoflexales bacterium]